MYSLILTIIIYLCLSALQNIRSDLSIFVHELFKKQLLYTHLIKKYKFNKYNNISKII